MQLNDLYDYKNQLMEDLLTNEEIVRLISDDVPFEKAAKLAYTQVFPYEYIPSTVQDGKTYICFDVDIASTDGKTFLVPALRIWILTHGSMLRLPEGGVRTDKLCSAICEVLNGSRKYGLGELNLTGVRRFAPMTDYIGKAMTFSAKEFNRPFSPKKQVTPSNRKTG